MGGKPDQPNHRPAAKLLDSLRGWSRVGRVYVLVTATLIAMIFLALEGPVFLAPTYHCFVDQRTLFGIPNCFNVISNVPFAVVGAVALYWLCFRPTGQSFIHPFEKLPYLVFFTGVFFTGVGSFWYHLKPSDARLPVDLLPMTCSFMSLTVATIIERVHARAGFLLMPPFLVFGVTSVLVWQFGDDLSRRDYRYYLFVQFFPPFFLALVVALFPPRYTRFHFLVLAFALFVLAKAFELNDRLCFQNIGVSGHSLKHVVAAISCYFVLLSLQRRLPSSTTEGFVHSDSANSI